MLSTLPPEILRLITDQIEHPVDLKRLCETCKRLRDLCIPRLYESVVIIHGKDRLQENDPENAISKAKSVPKRYLKYTKNLIFRTSLSAGLNPRCPHREDPLDLVGFFGPVMEENDVHENMRFKWDALVASYETLECLLDSIDPGNLRSFEWDMATCLPPSDRDYRFLETLQQRQTRLENLSIMVDPACGPRYLAEQDINPNNLSFRKLRSLSWKGLWRLEDLEVLREIVRLSGEQLETLTLDVTYSVRLVDGFSRMNSEKANKYRALVGDGFSNPFVRMAFGLGNDDGKILFPLLTQLSLTGVQFQLMGKELACGMRMSELKSLKLIHCSSCGELLYALESGPPLKLESFEFVADFASDSDTSSLSDVLTSFHGLRDCCIVLEHSRWWNFILRALMNHKATLRRLVCCDAKPSPNRTVSWDYRSDSSTEESSDPFTFHSAVMRDDIPPDSNQNIMFLLGSHEILSLQSLTHVGIGGHPMLWHQLWQVMAPGLKWTLIHFREDGEEFEASIGYELYNNREQIASFNRWAKAEEAFQCSYLGHAVAHSPTTSYEPCINIRYFADWAFSPNGFPDLKLIAHGDFSFDGRYARYNSLFCRNRSATTNTQGSKNCSNYRTLECSYSDSHLWDFVADSMDMLSAGPVHRLFSETVRLAPYV